MAKLSRFGSDSRINTTWPLLSRCSFVICTVDASWEMYPFFFPRPELQPRSLVMGDFQVLQAWRHWRSRLFYFTAYLFAWHWFREDILLLPMETGLINLSLLPLAGHWVGTFIAFCGRHLFPPFPFKDLCCSLSWSRGKGISRFPHLAFGSEMVSKP